MSLSIDQIPATSHGKTASSPDVAPADFSDMKKQQMKDREKMMFLSMYNVKNQDQIDKIKTVMNSLSDISKEINMKL